MTHISERVTRISECVPVTKTAIENESLPSEIKFNEDCILAESASVLLQEKRQTSNF